MQVFSDRRQKLLAQLPVNSLTVVFSGHALMRSEDESFPFVVNRNFYYLTGLDIQGAILFLYKGSQHAYEQLFILPYDEYLAKWVGGRMRKEEAATISGVKQIYDSPDFHDYFASMFNRNRGLEDLTLYLDLWHYEYDQHPSEALTFAKEVKVKYPALKINDLFPLLTKLRLIKDEYEIDCMKKAIAITKKGVETMMKKIRPGQNEMTMEGLFQFILMRELCNQTAFKTIASSGERSTILHYSDNNQIMEDGQLFLCDLGATYQNYCADISRTFPVNGHFSDRQKELYEVVLQAQKVVLTNAKPGITLRDLNDKVVEFYREELPKHGLNKDVSEYYFHGVSHHLGLDTHDVDGGLGSELKAGMVITNEPGLYIEDEKIGIRIEDDLLITDEGNEVLSQDIIREVADIEALMNQCDRN